MKVSKAELADARALSIRQPWAELILRRRKPIEIRTWTTKYRGLILIHASGGWVAAAAKELEVSKESVTHGAFVGIARLHDVRRFTKQDTRLLKNKCGGLDWWEPENYAWVLKNVQRIEPLPFKGRLGLYRPPVSIMRRISKLLAAAK